MVVNGLPFDMPFRLRANWHLPSGRALTLTCIVTLWRAEEGTRGIVFAVLCALHVTPPLPYGRALARYETLKSYLREVGTGIDIANVF